MAVRSKALYFRPTQSTKVTSISTPQQAGTHRQEFVQSLGKGGRVPQQRWRSTIWFPTAQMQRNSRWASVADLGRMSILETYRRRQGRDRLIAASLPAPFVFGQTLPLSGLDGWAVGMQPRHLGRRATSCGCWGFRCLGWTLVSSTAFLNALMPFCSQGGRGTGMARDAVFSRQQMRNTDYIAPCLRAVLEMWRVIYILHQSVRWRTAKTTSFPQQAMKGCEVHAQCEQPSPAPSTVSADWPERLPANRQTPTAKIALDPSIASQLQTRSAPVTKPTCQVAPTRTAPGSPQNTSL